MQLKEEPRDAVPSAAGVSCCPLAAHAVRWVGILAVARAASTRGQG